MAGPVGAVAAGIGAGAAMDTIYTVATDQPQGYVAAVTTMVENPSAGRFFLMLGTSDYQKCTSRRSGVRDGIYLTNRFT